MKNIISNILGVLIIGLAVYRVAFNELPIVAASFLTGIGAILFYFENKKIKKYLVRLVNLKLKK